MKLTIQYHAGNPNLCRIPELKIRPMPECEGGGWYMPREQAEALLSHHQLAEAWARINAMPIPTEDDDFDFQSGFNRAVEGALQIVTDLRKQEAA